GLLLRAQSFPLASKSKAAGSTGFTGIGGALDIAFGRRDRARPLFGDHTPRPETGEYPAGTRPRGESVRAIGSGLLAADRRFRALQDGLERRVFDGERGHPGNAPLHGSRTGARRVERRRS